MVINPKWGSEIAAQDTLTNHSVRQYQKFRPKISQFDCTNVYNPVQMSEVGFLSLHNAAGIIRHQPDMHQT